MIINFKHIRHFAPLLAIVCFLFGQSIDATGALVAYWQLNEGAGNTIKDSSGKGHDGEFGKGDPQWIAGISGSTLEFRELKRINRFCSLFR